MVTAYHYQILNVIGIDYYRYKRLKVVFGMTFAYQ